MTFAFDMQRTCVGANVFIDNTYQLASENYFKEHYNINVFRKYTTSDNGDTTIHMYMYPFESNIAATDFLREVFSDPHSDFYTTIGNSIWNWYKDSPYTYHGLRQIIEVNDAAPITDSLSSGDYTVEYEFKLSSM